MIIETGNNKSDIMSDKAAVDSATVSESPKKTTESNTKTVEIDAGAKKVDGPPKKESFQWSTPADEFAEDVESDNDDSENDESMEYMVSFYKVKKFSWSMLNKPVPFERA